jgi:hypothetical protein
LSNVDRVVVAEQKDPGRSDLDLISLVEAAGRHLGAVQLDKLGIWRSLNPVSTLLPANPAVHRPDSVTLQDDIAGRARPEQDRMIAREFDELNTSCSVMYFQCCHARTTRFSL